MRFYVSLAIGHYEIALQIPQKLGFYKGTFSAVSTKNWHLWIGPLFIARWPSAIRAQKFDEEPTCPS